MGFFFTSDLHLGHENLVIKGYRSFSSVDEMNDTLIDNWNDLVSEDDIVVILGDVVMGQRAKTLPLVRRLNGFKMLYCGNHDYPWVGCSAKERAKISDYFNLGGLDYIEPNGSGQMDIGGHQVNLCHFPYSGDHTDEERFTEHRPADNGNVLLHGHVHDMWKVNGRQINVGVDVWDFCPVPKSDILDLINEMERGS